MPHTTKLEHGIVAIDTEYARPLQDASHLIVENGRGAFVDVGVNSSTPLLLAALAESNLDAADVDFVFLTHVHLDHAGGAGLLLQHLPNARCVLHPRGAPHMIDPERLIAGTRAVYGERFFLNGRELQAFYTEGHARHHYCLHDTGSRGVFTGDSFGVSYRELDTAAGEFIFPTTTPVQFDPDEAHKSVDRVMSYAPQRLYLTHYSEVRDLERLADDMHKGIDAFVGMARKHANAENRSEALRNDIFKYFFEGLQAHGFSGDRDTMWSILQIDVNLNTQGLEVWLDRHG